SQAEAGIRDLYVSGVQTCALPICPSPRPAVLPGMPPEPAALRLWWHPWQDSWSRRRTRAAGLLIVRRPGVAPAATATSAAGSRKIGRASCRASVEGAAEAVPGAEE